MDLNEISLDEALSEMGEDLTTAQNRGDLARLADYYGLAPEAAYQPKGSRAPSIITRGEVQLFSNSFPRFADRLRLVEDYGFINCRRLKVFLEQVDHKGGWGKRRPAPDGGYSNPDLKFIVDANISLKDILARQSVVADSMLAQPSRLHQFLFRYLDFAPKLDLFNCYCEKNPAEKKHHLPYLKSFDLGGGVCIQSVCFMATVTLASYATSICGIAEITALAHPRSCVELSLSGFTFAMIKTYFQNVGLRSHLQVARKLSAPTTTLDDASKWDFAKSIRSYLNSGFPVILPVDHYFLASGNCPQDSIYFNNGWNHRGEPQQIEKVGHAVLLVGHGEKDLKLKTAAGYHLSFEMPFVFHDPGAMPFMVADLPELIEAGPYDPALNENDNGIFMPVTPAKVRLPLLRERSTEETIEERNYVGLFELASSFRRIVNTGAIPKPAEELGTFRLARCTKSVKLQGMFENSLQAKFDESLPIVLPAIVKDREVEPKEPVEWAWLEVFKDSVWIWNAEEPPRESLPDPEESVEDFLAIQFRYLIGIIYWNKGTRKVEVFPETRTTLLS